MKRPSWTSATQPVKTAKAIHNVFIAVVKAFACWTSIYPFHRKNGFRPPPDLWLKDSRMDVFSNSTTNKIQGNGYVGYDSSRASKACEAARIQADNPTCASEYPVFSKKNSCSHVKTGSRRNYGPADFGSLQTQASVKF